jgi:hypothetical protein
VCWKTVGCAAQEAFEDTLQVCRILKLRAQFFSEVIVIKS